MDKETLLERAAGITVSLRARNNVKVTLDGESLHGDENTLAVLGAFSSPKTMDQALVELENRVRGHQSWMELTGQILTLYRRGMLRDSSQPATLLRSHATSYDAAPVHIRMLNDQHRMASYQQAIRETVTPADVVVDVGTGTGVLAAMAALAGAKHVYAIERSAIAKLAQRLFDTNGLADRVTLVEGSSSQIELPEKADVMISELIGDDPLGENLLETTDDALKRLLKPGARLIPGVLRVYALPVTVPDERLRECVFRSDVIQGWRETYGIDFSSLVGASQGQNHALWTNSFDARDWAQLSDPVLLVEFDLKQSHSVAIEVSRPVRIQRAGLLTGILIYFEAELAKSVLLSTGPSVVARDNHWRSKVWIPAEPVALRAGDLFNLTYVYGAQGSVLSMDHPK